MGTQIQTHIGGRIGETRGKTKASHKDKKTK